LQSVMQRAGIMLVGEEAVLLGRAWMLGAVSV
jgi:hypothetical protein